VIQLLWRNTATFVIGPLDDRILRLLAASLPRHCCFGEFRGYSASGHAPTVRFPRIWLAGYGERATAQEQRARRVQPIAI